MSNALKPIFRNRRVVDQVSLWAAFFGFLFFTGLGYAQREGSSVGVPLKVLKATPATHSDGSGSTRLKDSSGEAVIPGGVSPRGESGKGDRQQRFDPSGNRDVDLTTAAVTVQSLNDSRPIGVGDKLSVSILEDEASPQTLAVSELGEIDAPYIGRMSARGLTCKRLAAQLKRMLEREYYHQATVLIALDSPGRVTQSKGRIYVFGQVRSPGPQELPVDEVYTVSKAILRAGGFANYANKRKVKVVRGGSEKTSPETVILDLVEILEKGHREKDIQIEPDDLITVPEKWLNF